MTILGKILVFFVLVLSLFWNALTVSTFITRTNWANEAKKANERAKEAADSASFQRKLAEQIREVANAQLAAKQQEIDRLRTSNNQLNTEVAAANKGLADKIGAQNETEPKEQIAAANIKLLQVQVDQLQKRIGEQEKAANDATIRSEADRAVAQKAEIDRNAALKRADELEQKLLATTDRLNDIVGGRGAGSSRVAPPDDFKATVTAVSGDLVEISLGSNAKLQKDAVLTVYRTKPTPKYVGTLTITSVDPQGAVGRFTPPAGVLKPGPNDMPKKDDNVGVSK